MNNLKLNYSHYITMFLFTFSLLTISLSNINEQSLDIDVRTSDNFETEQTSEKNCFLSIRNSINFLDKS